MDLYNVHSIVERELVENPETRNSDVSLYLAVCERINPGITDGFSYRFVMENRKNLGLPNFETVGRVRRHLQEHNTMLRATAPVEEGRYRMWKKVRDYVQE